MARVATKVGERDGLTLRGRDVAFELKEANVDPKVVTLLINMAEILHVHSKAVADMATMFEQMMGLLEQVTTAQGNISQEVERFRRKYADEDPAPNAGSFPNQERSFEDGNGS
jgi:hypothetical protein